MFGLGSVIGSYMLAQATANQEAMALGVSPDMLIAQTSNPALEKPCRHCGRSLSRNESTKNCDQCGAPLL